MKNILLLILFGLYAYATSETIELLHRQKEQNMEKFRKEAKDYYKAWAVGYCLGYYKIEDNVKFNYEKPLTEVKGTDFIADSKIDKWYIMAELNPLKR